MLQNRLFFALASRSGFGPAISDPVERSSIVFCNSVSADRIVMAASRLLLATAACVILLSFAARLRKSYWSEWLQEGCDSDLSADFLHFGASKREVWSVDCEVQSEKCEVWSVKEAVRSEKCEMWSVKWEVWTVKCEVWILKCGLWSVKCGLWSVKCEVRSVKWEVWS